MSQWLGLGPMKDVVAVVPPSPESETALRQEITDEVRRLAAESVCPGCGRWDTACLENYGGLCDMCV